MKNPMVLPNLGYTDPQPYENALAKELPQTPIGATFSAGVISFDSELNLTRTVVWLANTKNTDVARQVANGILEGLANTRQRAFKTVQIDFRLYSKALAALRP